MVISLKNLVFLLLSMFAVYFVIVGLWQLVFKKPYLLPHQYLIFYSLRKKQGIKAEKQKRNELSQPHNVRRQGWMMFWSGIAFMIAITFLAIMNWSETLERIKISLPADQIPGGLIFLVPSLYFLSCGWYAVKYDRMIFFSKEVFTLPYYFSFGRFRRSNYSLENAHVNGRWMIIGGYMLLFLSIVAFIQGPR